MKKVLRFVRNNQPVNASLRFVLKHLNKAVLKTINRWPVYGEIALNFNGVDIKMYSEADDHVVTLLYYNRAYHEAKDLKLFMALANQSDVVFDIGANTGIYSVLCSKINSQLKIFAFEPNPVNIRRLQKNLALNNCNNVTIIDKALGNKDSEVNFAVPTNDTVADTSSVNIEFSHNTYQGEIEWKTITVEQTTLNAIVAEKNISKIDLIKVDVEGYEREVFEGAWEMLKKFKPIIQCEIFLDEPRRVFFNQFLNEAGYYAYLILNDGILRIDQNLVANPGSLNYIFSPKRSETQFLSFKNIPELIREID